MAVPLSQGPPQECSGGLWVAPEFWQGSERARLRGKFPLLQMCTPNPKSWDYSTGLPQRALGEDGGARAKLGSEEVKPSEGKVNWVSWQCLRLVPRGGLGV